MPVRKLRICEFNVENLFVSMDYYEGQDLEHLSDQEWRALSLAQLRKKQKPLPKLWGLAQAIRDIDPDVLMLVEVGGEDSLKNFNRHFLEDRFDPYFVEGNSRRSIDLAFLVKKGLSYRAEPKSHRETPVEVSTLQGKYEARFSRDVAELALVDDSGVKLILLLVHLKSRLSTEQDFQGRDLRTAEAIALAQLYDRMRAEKPDIPIVLGGDFNTEVASLEMEVLRRTDMTDFHELIGTAQRDRVSLVHFDYGGRGHGMALDYLFVSPQLKDSVIAEESYTYRYKTFHGIPEALPESQRARQHLPSDHYPVVLTIRMPD